MELNGERVRAEDIAPLALYNYGNYTTMLVKDGRVRGLNLHLERLDSGAKLLFGRGIDPRHIRQLIRQVVADQSHAIIVRVTVFCKDFDLSHPGKTNKLDMLVTTRPAPAHVLPVSLQPLRYQRDIAEHKTTNIGGALYRRRIAQLDGFDDALFMNDEQEISEGPMWNIGFIKKSTVVFPAASRLPGISTELLLPALEGDGIKIQTKVVSLHDVADMDAAFILSAGSGIRGVKAIGEHVFAETNNLNKLSELYEAIPYDEL